LRDLSSAWTDVGLDPIDAIKEVGFAPGGRGGSIGSEEEQVMATRVLVLVVALVSSWCFR
jgi:hypothetical protein